MDGQIRHRIASRFEEQFFHWTSSCSTCPSRFFSSPSTDIVFPEQSRACFWQPPSSRRHSRQWSCCQPWSTKEWGWGSPAPWSPPVHWLEMETWSAGKETVAKINIKTLRRLTGLGGDVIPVHLSNNNAGVVHVLLPKLVPDGCELLAMPQRSWPPRGNSFRPEPSHQLRPSPLESPRTSSAASTLQQATWKQSLWCSLPQSYCRQAWTWSCPHPTGWPWRWAARTLILKNSRILFAMAQELEGRIALHLWWHS